MPNLNVYVSEKTYAELYRIVELHADQCPSISIAVGRLAEQWAKLNDRTKGPRDWHAVVLRQ